MEPSSVILVILVILVTYGAKVSNENLCINYFVFETPRSISPITNELYI
jgi:hypothetical protein